MRHHRAHRKFHREKRVRVALIRSLVRSLVLQEAIVTTVAKAKEIRPVVEKLVTMSMDNSLNSKRVIASRVGLEVAKKLHDTFAKRYEDRKGGYTRITRLGRVGKRVGEQARIEFVK